MRGIVIDTPRKISPTSLVRNGPVNPASLRLWALYWDQVLLPKNNLLSEGNPYEFGDLVSAGIALNRDFMPPPGQMSAGIWNTYLQARAWGEDEIGGNWSLALGPEAIDASFPPVPENRTLFVRLVNAVPVPNGETPIGRVITFRDQCAAEREAFMVSIEEMYLDVIGSPDRPMAERVAFQRLQKSIDDQLHVSRSSFNVDSGFSLADLTVGFAITPEFVFDAISDITMHGFSLWSVAKSVASVGFGFGATYSFSLSHRKRREGPEVYVSRIRDRLEWDR